MILEEKESKDSIELENSYQILRDYRLQKFENEITQDYPNIEDLANIEDSSLSLLAKSLKMGKSFVRRFNACVEVLKILNKYELLNHRKALFYQKLTKMSEFKELSLKSMNDIKLLIKHKLHFPNEELERFIGLLKSLNPELDNKLSFSPLKFTFQNSKFKIVL